MAISRRMDAEQQGVEDNPLASVQDRLNELARLDEDWDSYGAHPPAARAIDEALHVVSQMLERFWPTAREQALPSSISPLPSGGIELEWRNSGQLIAIDVGPGGEWGYLRRVGTGREAIYDEEAAVSRDALFPLLSELLHSANSG